MDDRNGFEERDAPAVPGRAKGRWMAALAAAAAIVVLAAALLAGVLGKTPEQAVSAAFSKTDERLERLGEKLFSQMPMYRLLLPGGEPRSTGFEISLSAVSLGQEGIKGELISALAKLFSIRGDAACDPEAGIYELRGRLNMGGAVLLDLFAQLSPERLALQAPKFSDTVLAVNPAALADEIRSSRFYSPALDGKIQRMQDQLLEKTACVTASLDAGKLWADTRAILDGLLVNAAYGEAVTENGFKVYTAALDGGQVRETVLALARYLHEDPGAGGLFPGLREEGLLDALEKDLAQLPAALTVKVGKGGLVSSLELSIDQEGAFTWDGVRYDGLTVLCGMPDGVEDVTLECAVRGMGREAPFRRELRVAGSYADSVNTVAVSAGTGGVPRLTLDMALNENGAAELKLRARQGGGETAILALRGTVTAEADMLKWDFPSVGLTLDSGGLYGNVTVGLKAHGERKILSAPLQPVSGATPFFAMTEAEMTAELQKYYDGLNTLVGDLTGKIKSVGTAGDRRTP